MTDSSAPTFRQLQDPDGAKVTERYEEGALVSTTRIKEFPSGRTLMRDEDAAGNLTRESHSYGTLDLLLSRSFRDQKLGMEIYLIRGKPVSRAKYQAAIASYPDMPQPSAELADWAAEMRREVSRASRARRKATAKHGVDPQRAARLDDFCREMLSSTSAQDAVTWMESPGSTLGELDRAASRRLLRMLLDRGAVRIWACDIESLEAEVSNTGNLVVELPDGDGRERLLAYLHTLAVRQGFEGDPDDGQRMAYVKLD